MGQYNLNRLFKPRHVAVVGASEKPGSIGSMLDPARTRYKELVIQP